MNAEHHRTALRGIILGLLLLLSFQVQPSTAVELDATPPYDSKAVPAEPELLIFQLRYGNMILASDLLAYSVGETLLLPLGHLAQILEIGIDVDAADGRATGVLPDGRSFDLSIGQGEVSIGERAESVPPQAIDVQPDDIFIDINLLSQWLPVDFETNYSALAIQLQPREELPFQERAARDQRQAALTRSGGSAPETPLPRFQQPARLWSVPFVDVSTEVGYNRLSGAPAEGTARFSALAAGGLLYMDSTAFLAGSDRDPLTDARFRLGRKDPGAGLLGPLHATEFAFGDIVTPRIRSIAHSRSERGAIVSSFPLELATEFDETTLTGDLPLGWEIELYRGDVLLDFRAADNGGRFVFPDVPLLIGLNLFRLVYYGPQGQKREETRRVFVGAGLIADGEHYYRASLSQSGTSLFELDRSHGFNEFDQDPESGEGRYSFEYATAIGGVTVQSSLASLPFEEERRTYASAGASAALGPVFGSIDAVVDEDGGWAARTLGQTQLIGINVLAEGTVFSDFLSEREQTKLVSRARLRLDGGVSFAPLPPLSYSLDLKHEVRESGESSVEASGRVSTRAGRLSLSNTLAYTKRTALLADDRIDLFGESELRGATLVSGRAGPVFLRGGLDYELAPDPSVGTMAVSGEWAVDRNVSMGVTVNHDWANSSGSGAILDLNRLFDDFSVGAYAAGQTDGEYRFGLSASFAFGLEPRTRSWSTSPQAIAERGAISAQVFLDRNVNGTLDAGDELLEGVEIRAGGTGKRMKTDAEGIAFITGIPAYTRSRIVLIPGTLEDPYMHPEREGVELVVRPAERAIIDFPVVLTGEVDGTIWVSREGELTPGRNLVVQLADSGGNVLDETRSGFDGFYLLDRIRPGNYRVRVRLAEPDQRHREAEVIRDVTIGPEGTVVSGLDLILPKEAPR